MKELAGKKRKRSRTMSNTNINIPNDIVIEIFSWVPAKSLLRLRWACKYLFDLITCDHVFTKKHLHHHTPTSTTTTTTYDNDRIINNTSLLISKYRSSLIYTMNFRDVVNNVQDDYEDDDIIKVNMDCYNLPIYDDDDLCLQFCGSCNGLILLDHSSYRLCPHQDNTNTYFLWNPCTREFKELAREPSNTYPINESYRYYILGFGYDHTIDDYKVIRMISYSSQLDDSTIIDQENNEIGVYTLGSNSWRTKMVADPLVSKIKLMEVMGLFVNGALHWMIEWSMSTTIMSFDITKEEPREIEVPNFITDVQGRSLILTMLNDCLCISHFEQDFVIWMMKDYGVKDSWTKMCTIYIEKVLVDIASCQSTYSMEPMKQYCNKDGGILMVFNKDIIVACDSKNKEARFIYKFKNLEDCGYRFLNGTYIESLVSLNSGMYLTLAGSKTSTVEKKNLLEYEVFGFVFGGKHLVKRRAEKQRSKLLQETRS